MSGGSTGSNITLPIGQNEKLRVPDKLFSEAGPGKRALQSAALAALDQALDRTTIYMRDVQADLSKYDRRAEDEISGLWRNASIAINEFDPDLSDVCYVKSQGWLDPKVWNSPAFKSMKLGLNDLRVARMKFNAGNNAATTAPKRKKSPPVSASEPHLVPGWYGIVGAIILAGTFLILVALIFGPDRSDRTPLINILVALGAAGSATFLGGTAAAKGKIPLPGAANAPLEYSAGGGVAVLIITLALMFRLNPAPHPKPAPVPSETQNQAVPAIAPPNSANDQMQLKIWTAAGRKWRDSYTAFQYVRQLGNQAGDSRCFGIFIRESSDPKVWDETFPDTKDQAGNYKFRKWTDEGDDSPPGRVALKDGPAAIQIEPGTMRIFYIDPGMDQNVQSLDRITAIIRAWDTRPEVIPGQPRQPQCDLGP